MQYIQQIPNPGGAYPAPQSAQAIGLAAFPDAFHEAFCAHNGFVTLTIEGDAVTAMEPNVTAWEAWKASLTEAPLDQLRAEKLRELSLAGEEAIVAGCDVTLADGTAGHLSLTPEDQINLTTAQSAVQAGAEGYPYHLDGQLCRVYGAADILTMGGAATAHKLYHTTYCNHLLTWARRAEDREELHTIAYGGLLPEDLAANMAGILEACGYV